MTTKMMTMCAMKTRKRKSRPHRFSGISKLVLAALLATGLGVAVWTPPASAAVGKVKATKVPTLRTVEGTVCDKDGEPIQGAVVYLQDPKTMAVRSYLSDQKGHFHFRQLPMSNDFGLWAELNGQRTKTKNISQFNSHPDLNYTLKLDIDK